MARTQSPYCSVLIQTAMSTGLKWRLIYSMQSRLLTAVSQPVDVAHLVQPQLLLDKRTGSRSTDDSRHKDA